MARSLSKTQARRLFVPVIRLADFPPQGEAAFLACLRSRPLHFPQAPLRFGFLYFLCSPCPLCLPACYPASLTSFADRDLPPNQKQLGTFKFEPPSHSKDPVGRAFCMLCLTLCTYLLTVTPDYPG